ncbi:DNA repair protein RadA [Candidatus Magnetomoraceae bacterium gMMP-15]
MKKNSKTLFVCQSCGYQTVKWIGKCPECGKWESLVEQIKAPESDIIKGLVSDGNAPVLIDSVDMNVDERLPSGIKEFDRVLGGGLVPGSLVLIGGDPGIGKSTLMLQALYGFARNDYRVLYVSGEESVRQIKLRSERLGTSYGDMWIVSETNLDAIQAMIKSNKPNVLVIDSIQTMFRSDISSAPGSISQVREATMRLMVIAKKTGIPIFLVGHVTKEGAIAGPRLLEHMVDTVLYFEGDRNHVFRILRAVKNRFGSTNEIGVFEMKSKGLEQVPNPSAVFLSERPINAPGSVVSASMEGTRPIMIEIQALASTTVFGNPRRTILGLDQNRVALLTAVVEKQIGLKLMQHDIFMNVAGGVKVHEPAVDMGIVSAVISSFIDKPIQERTVVFGEVGLTGEVRGISHIETRISETKKMGFERCVIPASNLKRMTKKLDLELIGIKTVAQAMRVLFPVSP